MLRLIFLCNFRFQRYGIDRMEKKNNTQYADMFVEDDVLHLVYKPLDVLDISIAKILVKDRLSFVQGNAYPTLFDIREVKSTTKEARDYLANEGNELVMASALLVNSSVTKMIGNFFITVSRPKNPTRLFLNKDKSLEWLEQYNPVLV